MTTRLYELIAYVYLVIKDAMLFFLVMTVLLPVVLFAGLWFDSPLAAKMLVSGFDINYMLISGITISIIIMSSFLGNVVRIVELYLQRNVYRTVANRRPLSRLKINNKPVYIN